MHLFRIWYVYETCLTKRWISFEYMGGLCVWREHNEGTAGWIIMLPVKGSSKCMIPVHTSHPHPFHGILQARILEWVAMPFSRGSSWPRDRTWVSHIVGSFITIWASGEALTFSSLLLLLFVSKKLFFHSPVSFLVSYGIHSTILSIYFYPF